MFFGKKKPLTCKEVKSALKRMGFKEFKQKGTSHQHWKKIVNCKLYKVTVDCPKAPFSQILIKSMSHQAGVSVKIFYTYCLDKKKKGCPLGVAIQSS